MIRIAIILCILAAGARLAIAAHDLAQSRAAVVAHIMKGAQQ